MAITLTRKADGKVFDFDNADDAEELLRSGDAVAAPGVAIYNPEDKKTYSFDDPEDITRAVQAGGLLEGSKKHAAASMSGLEAGVRRVAQGATFGLQDEAAGALDALFTSKSYAQGRDESRRLNDAATENLGPELSTALEVAGGVGTAFIPGMGVLGAAGKGVAAGSKAAMARSAIQGALGGFGYSEGKNLEEIATDTALGGALGAGVEFVAPRAGRMIKNTFNKAKAGLADALDPNVQRILATGASAKEMKGPMRVRATRAAQELSDIGALKAGDLLDVVPDAKNGVKLVFDEASSAGLPDKRTLQDRVRQITAVTGKKIGDLYDASNANGLRVDVDSAILERKLTPDGPVLKETILDLISNATPGTEEGLSQLTDGWLLRIKDNADDFKELLKIKQGLKESMQLNTERGMKNRTARIAETLYSGLNDAMKDQVDELALKSGNATLTRLNAMHHAASTFDSMLEGGIVADERAPKMLGLLNQRSAVSGALGATVGSAFGGIGAPVGALAAQSLDQFLTSTEGRLARAQLGERLARGAGKIPRQSGPIREAVKQSPQIFAKVLGPDMVAAIQKMPEHAWQDQVRILMPVFEQLGMFERSDFPTEVDGKVALPDRLTASRQLEEKKLSPSAEFLRRNQLIQNGTLPDELLPQTPQEILKRMENPLPLESFGQNLAGY
jgi:hypothetical protein